MRPARGSRRAVRGLRKPVWESGGPLRSSGRPVRRGGGGLRGQSGLWEASKERDTQKCNQIQGLLLCSAYLGGYRYGCPVAAK